MEKAFAFFDFDGTVIPGDSIIALIRFLRRKRLSTGKQFRAAVRAGALYLAGKMTAEESKEAAYAPLAGLTLAQADALAREFCAKVLSRRIRPAALAEMERLRREGAEVWLVSASASFYLEPLKEYLPVTRVVATELAAGEDGTLTGKLRGENCKGYQKPFRLAEVLASLGDTVDYERSSAYGDSRSDGPMLDLCARKVCVNAKRGLRARMKDDPSAEFPRWRGRTGRKKG